MNYAAHLLTLFSIYALAATSLNLVVGHLGLLSLAHAVFLALGAYAYGVLSVAHAWAWLPATLAGMVLAAFASVPLALAADRFKGGFFILVSLAFQAVMFGLMRNAYAAGEPLGSPGNLTNGLFGVAEIPRPAIAGTVLEPTTSYALFSLSVSLLGLALCRQVLRSPWGRMLTTLRDDELAARSLGKTASKVRLQVFALSGALAATAGSLHAAYVSYTDMNLAGLDECILLLAMVVVGGAGNFRGPLLGAAILIAVPELLRMIGISGGTGAHLRVLLYGAFLLLVIALRPQGIAGAWRIR